jgi:hypothetical protein
MWTKIDPIYEQSSLYLILGRLRRFYTNSVVTSSHYEIIDQSESMGKIGQSTIVKIGPSTVA